LSFLDTVLPLFPYTSGGQELLGSWKIEGLRGLSHDFAAVFADCLASPRFKDAILVPVPPRPGKIRDKGWDQIEELSVILARNHGITVSRCLERTSHIAQKTLDRLGRKTNLKGHIAVRKEFPVPSSAILLDDLMTTGSTLDACAEALKNAGCGKVCGLTLFFD
jgi:predicted amidophosphoribosyltransferase